MFEKKVENLKAQLDKDKRLVKTLHQHKPSIRVTELERQLDEVRISNNSNSSNTHHTHPRTRMH